MALNESSNLLLSTSHYHRQRSPFPHQNSLNEAIVHGLESLHSSERRASSVQSLQTMFPSRTSTTSKSYPRLRNYFTRQLSSPTPPFSSNTTLSIATHQNSPVCSNLSNTDNRRVHQISISKTIPQDEDVISTNFLKDTRITSSEHTLNDNRLKTSEPIEIRVRCIFSRVGEIDTLNERYTAEIFFEASWYDLYDQIGLKYDPQMGHFNPQLVVLNHIGDSLRHEKWHTVNKINDNNLIEITEHHKIRGIFWERMELNHFPYDVQELSLSITTPLTTNDIKFIENKTKPSGVNRIVFSDQQSWCLYEHVEFTYEQHREEYSLNFNQIHPVVVCTCHVGRKCGYYIWNAYFLIFLITSASLCTFAIPPSNSHGRLQITCTLLLTSVTFRWVVNKSLPPISYLTALDIYAISSIVALCIVNVFHGLISYIYYDQIYVASAQSPTTTTALHLSLYPDYSLCRLDRYAFFIFLSLFCFFQIFVLLWTIWKPYQRRREMRRKDEKTRAQLKYKVSTELLK